MADNNQQQLKKIVQKAGKSKNESAKGSKRGRMGKKPSFQRYCAESRANKNKIKKLKKYVSEFPLDLQAAARLKAMTSV